MPDLTDEPGCDAPKESTPGLPRSMGTLRGGTLQQIFAAAPLGIYVVDADFRLCAANDVARAAFGAGRDWIGGEFAELIHATWSDSYAADMLQRFRETLATGEPHAHAQHSEQRRDRRQVEHYEWQIRRITLEDGRFAVVCYFKDISARVRRMRELERQREALRAEKERLELAQRATGLGIFDWDMVANTSEVSPEWRRIYGLPDAAPMPTHEDWRRLVHPDDREQAAAQALTYAKSGDSYEHEFRVIWPDGSVHWVVTGGKTLFDAEGRALRLLGTAMDVTARKRAAEEITRSEERFRVALLHAPLTMYTTDRELRCTWVHNPALRFTAPQILGKRDDEVLPAESAAPLIAMKQRVLESGCGERTRITTVVGGESITFDNTIEPQRDAAGNVCGLIGAAMDITDLVNAKSTAEAASRAKDEFLAVLSHELRTPLTPVLATAELLEVDPALSGPQRDMVRMIRRNVELEARLIDDLLDVTRISRNKLELTYSIVDVHQAVVRVIDMCRGDATAKSIAIHAELGARSHVVRADSARLQQIIWNLLKNAIKFPQDGGHVVVATANPTPGQLALSVTDTGVGIEVDALPHIFDAFEQGGREVTQKFGGLGLGLAISKSLAELHGGTIRVASPGKDRGATFTFEMPTSAEAESSSETQRAPPAADLACAVLLVEDHADTRQVMEYVLTGLGCTVCTAGSVAEALSIAATRPFQILVSDIGLPDAAGTELMRELKARYGLKGIALSGFGMDKDLMISRESGFDAHLVKPINLDLLEETVRRLAGGR